jgi:hypothetical protein
MSDREREPTFSEFDVPEGLPWTPWCPTKRIQHEDGLVFCAWCGQGRSHSEATSRIYIDVPSSPIEGDLPRRPAAAMAPPDAARGPSRPSRPVSSKRAAEAAREGVNEKLRKDQAAIRNAGSAALSTTRAGARIGTPPLIWPLQILLIVKAYSYEDRLSRDLNIRAERERRTIGK